MLSFRMPIKIFTLLVIALISWNLIPNSASSAPSRYTQYVKTTAETIAKNNQLTNKFQNDLFLLHEEKYFLNASKNLKKYHEILKPPTIAYDVTSDSYNAALYEECVNDDKKIRIIDHDFQNLSSICLQERLDKIFMEYTNELFPSASSRTGSGQLYLEEKNFLKDKVNEANKVSVDFYTENYSAYILHSQYAQIKKELETMNSKLYDVFMEVKHYPKKLPNATTTSCT